MKSISTNTYLSRAALTASVEELFRVISLFHEYQDATDYIALDKVSLSFLLRVKDLVATQHYRPVIFCFSSVVFNLQARGMDLYAAKTVRLICWTVGVLLIREG